MDAFEAISLPESSVLVERKFFSLSEANRALTLVQKIVSDIVQDYKRLRELYDACRDLDAKGKTLEAEEARQQYAFLTDHLSSLNEELEKVGCELKDYHLGLVDFPALREGREVYLCWKLGEEKVEHWHEIDGGYASRQPIAEEFVQS